MKYFKITFLLLSIQLSLTSSKPNVSLKKAVNMNVINFGALGNGINDDYNAIQNAIDSAAQTGDIVLLPVGVYSISNTLIVPAGVTLQGEGRGSTSTSTPHNGTIIKNTSTLQTIRITGHNVSIKDMVVYDTDNEGSVGGIEILADSSNVESVILEEVLIFGFGSGVALKLEAKDGGGINYCSFYDVRIRHAKTGILIQEDEGSFVNSNSFYHGAISGGGFDYCLHVVGGNNNVFNATVMEPYSSLKGHLVVEEGQIVGNDIRIEGAQQLATIPLVEFKSNTANSVINGIYSGGLTVDLGNNFINFRSDKSLNYENSNSNLFVNACFNGVKSNTIPFWEISNANVLVTELSPEILPGYQVLKLTVPAGIETYLRPSSGFLPEVLAPAKYDYVNFGAYIKTNTSNVISTTCKAPAGTTTGIYHTGDTTWHMVGMTSGVDRINSYNPKFHITTVNQTNPVDIYITTPVLNFGNTAVKLEAAPISSAGGILTGTLTMGMSLVVAANFLTLPNQGNVFEINGTTTISRINHLTQDRFPKGTVITLLFNEANTSVTNGGYITLIGGFTSTLNSSLTLISLGNGTWREVNRNL